MKEASKRLPDSCENSERVRELWTVRAVKKEMGGS